MPFFWHNTLPAGRRLPKQLKSCTPTNVEFVFNDGPAMFVLLKGYGTVSFFPDSCLHLHAYISGEGCSHEEREMKRLNETRRLRGGWNDVKVQPNERSVNCNVVDERTA